MLFPPCYPILAEGGLVVTPIHGRVRDLQSASVTLGQRKGPFRWAAYQILGVTLKKVRSEHSFGACGTNTCRYWARICTGGIRNSLVNPRLTLNGQLSIENERPIRVMLGFQMASEGSRRQAHAAEVTLHPMTFRGGVDWS